MNKDAVIGLLRLFNRLLCLAVANYANYCDKEIDWKRLPNGFTLKVNEEFEWLQNEIEIINGLLLLSTLFVQNESLISSIIRNFVITNTHESS